MSPVADSDRAVARAAAAAFGGKPRVDRYYDEAEQHSVDILCCADRPTPGYSTYSTVGLYRAENLLDERNVPVEMAGVCAGDVEDFPRILATAAFLVIKEGWLAAPGVVFPALLSDYSLSPTLQHVMWSPPFPWDGLGSVDVEPGLDVHWLLAVPISESERAFLVEEGYDRLDALFDEHEVEYFDLERPPLV